MEQPNCCFSQNKHNHWIMANIRCSTLYFSIKCKLLINEMFTVILEPILDRKNVCPIYNVTKFDQITNETLMFFPSLLLPTVYCRLKQSYTFTSSLNGDNASCISFLSLTHSPSSLIGTADA